jgi:hypothetical protein
MSFENFVWRHYPLLMGISMSVMLAGIVILLIIGSK